MLARDERQRVNRGEAVEKSTCTTSQRRPFKLRTQLSVGTGVLREPASQPTDGNAREERLTGAAIDVRLPLVRCGLLAVRLA